MYRSTRNLFTPWLALLIGCAGSVLLESCGGNTSGPTSSSAASCPACYAGQWRLQQTLTVLANPPVCARPGDLGVAMTIAPMTFDVQGSIAFPPGSCQGCSGTVDSGGNFKLALPGDTSGGTCPAGQVSGKCTTVNSCAGEGTQGADKFTVALTRQ